MKADEFLRVIYGSIGIGTTISKPKTVSEVLDIRDNGHIYYRIGEANKKAVTRKELLAVFEVLSKGAIEKAQIRVIATDAKPCNVATIEWLLVHAGVAERNKQGVLRKRW